MGHGPDFLLAGEDPHSDTGGRLFGESERTLEEAVALGKTEAGLAWSRDLLSAAGVASNDLLICGNARDILAGGEGMDTIVGARAEI